MSLGSRSQFNRCFGKGSMFSKALWLPVALIGLVLLAATGQATAAVNARLVGPFDTHATIVGGNEAPRGTHVERLWRFRPLCASGPCTRVRLLRQTSNRRRAKSI